MDYNSLKWASSLLSDNFVSKKNLSTLLDDSSEYYILRSISDPYKRKICHDIIKLSLLSRIRDGKLLIPSEIILKEIANHLADENIDLISYEIFESRIYLTLASTKWFIRFIKPRVWFRIEKVTLNSEEQKVYVEYGFDNSFFDFAVKEAVNYYNRSYIKVIEKTDMGGKISVDLKEYIEDFVKKAHVKNLDCSIFDLVSFSSVHHSLNGINLICDQNWAEIVNNMHMRLDVIEEQKATKIPSVWLMHKDS